MNKNNIFFLSDTHYYHKNIIQYSNRPFSSLEEMHEVLIENWNKWVKKGDLIYVLGDFAITWNKKQDQEKIEQLLQRLNGQKQLIIGNHDRDAVKCAHGWDWVGHYKEIKPYGQKIILFHYRILNWHHKHKNSQHLFGHSHCITPEPLNEKCLDVGVDGHDYTPLSFDYIQYIMENKYMEPKQIDHHEFITHVEAEYGV